MATPQQRFLFFFVGMFPPSTSWPSRSWATKFNTNSYFRKWSECILLTTSAQSFTFIYCNWNCFASDDILFYLTLDVHQNTELQIIICAYTWCILVNIVCDFKSVSKSINLCYQQGRWAYITLQECSKVGQLALTQIHTESKRSWMGCANQIVHMCLS